MLIKNKRALLAGLAIASVLTASPLLAESRKEYTLSCSANGFTGTAYVTAVRNGDLLFATTTGYTIKAPRESQSRTSANLNLRVWGATKNAWSPWSYSNDNLQQDGVRRPVFVKASVNESRLGAVEVNFIFDKTGTDPRCTAKEMIRKF